MSGLQEHLATGLTTVANCWAVTRTDGATLGFTDHDEPLEFGGIGFAASAAMTARVFQQSTGLSVDNSEAIGALSSDAISEADIAAGKYDDAEVRAWKVNWADVNERELVFRGTLGEITRTDGSFRAELRGLAERLNTPRGLVYQRECSAQLGDARCGVELANASFFETSSIASAADGRIFEFELDSQFPDRWFAQGRMEITSGEGVGQVGVIAADETVGQKRQISLRESLRGAVVAGDQARLVAGCDKTADVCRAKFQNFLNFRGFPHIPGDDWLLSYPTRSGANDGGRLR